MRRFLCLLAAVWVGLLSACDQASSQSAFQYDLAVFDTDRITINPNNPYYWRYKQRPVVLIGASSEDNLFQVSDIERELHLLHALGGNYVRCTMSSRDPGDVWPFKKNGERFDLNQPDQTYWGRFDHFLNLCNELDIIVQIEVWATWDFYRDPWIANPFNPINNVQYDEQTVGLPTRVETHAQEDDNPFFHSVAAANDKIVLLEYQHKYVDALLSYSLKYPNVLYCMDNETSVTPKWGAYWSEYIKSAAVKQGLVVHTTEMWDPHKLASGQHRHTLKHPQTYSFLDISQNNHQIGQTHWDNAQWFRRRVENPRRPINSVKVYGADGAKHGSSQEAVERFWRNLIGGLASTRFHRSPSGLGLNETAQASIRSARMLLDEFDLVAAEPNNAKISQRSANEAYASVGVNEAAIYFPRQGEVLLDASAFHGSLIVRWLDVANSRWSEPVIHPIGDVLLTAPWDGPQVAVVESTSN